MTLTWNDAVEEIKSRLDIVDVISKHVILKKRGMNYIGLCPFHNEKTPSFIVSPQKGIYKCFGCGKGGDAITFLMEISGQSYAETIRDLARQFNIELPKNNNNYEKSQDKKSKIIEALTAAQKKYTQFLLEDSSAKNAYSYLMDRGITKDIIEKYGLGYSLNSYDSISKGLKEFGYDILLEAGLISEGKDGNSYYDRFRDRLMIPIFDEKGNVVAFGSRTLKKDDDGPKYINSPDSIVYNKSKILYGFNFASNSIRKNDSILIMEGYFDVITAQVNGVENAVGTCGTALTPEHVKLISRYCPSRKIYLAFDTDKAGQNATTRGAEVIREQLSTLGNIKQYSSLNTFDEINSSLNDDKYSCEIRVVSPPDGKDPDEYIREHGGEKYIEHVKKAPLLIDYKLNQVLKNYNSSMSPTEKLHLAKDVCPILNEINNPIAKNEYIKLAASTVRISETALKSELSKYKISGSYTLREFEPNVKQIVTNSSNLAKNPQKNLLSLYITEQGFLNKEFLAESLRNVKFDDENLENLKQAIDKISCSVNNIKELTDTLYTEFAKENGIKEIITDLIYLSETFKDLNEADFTLALSENISNIEKLNSKKIKEELILQNQESTSDEEKEIEYQKQLMEKLKKLRIGDYNE